MRERCEIRKGERINAHSVAVRRQLHQAQFGAIRTLSQELGIEAYVLARFKFRDEIIEGGRCSDYSLQRLRRTTWLIWVAPSGLVYWLYNPAMHIMQVQRRYKKP